MGLTLDSIDLDNKMLTVDKQYHYHKFSNPKTKESNRTLPLCKVVHDDLRNLIDRLVDDNPHQRLFESLNPSNIRRAFDSGAKLAKVKRIRLHDLRHSCASMLANAGCDYEQIKAFLGHNDMRVTLNIYTHLYPHKFDDIANKIDKLTNEAEPENKQKPKSSV